MNFFESIIYSLSWTMETPTNFGWFHIMFVAILIIATALICFFFRNASDKGMRRIALICWITILAFEVYKQLVYSYTFDGTVGTWKYQWYAFPFQLCSSPLYILPFVAFMKDCKFRDAMMCYLSTFSLFGGLVVYIYPNDVFTTLGGINIQTMVHHGTQILVGVYFFLYNRQKLGVKYFLLGIPVFIGMTLIAIGLNELMHAIFVANGIDDTFNMFYISPYHPNHLPILADIWKAVHPVAFVFIYVLGFIGAGGVVFLVMLGVYALVKLIARHKNLRTHAVF